MAKTPSEHLLAALEDLGEEELKRFKHKLPEMQLKEGYRAIARGALKKADVLDLSDLLINYYKGDYALEVTVEALRSINQRELAEKLAQATGTGALNSQQEVDTQRVPELEEKALLKEPSNTSLSGSKPDPWQPCVQGEQEGSEAPPTEHSV